ncbi:matrix Gla protein [Microcaecilia unicolor]|uniref:Matrix Gla protein n=1 Tax=Microcaecilia unicolor TaxID=1415580 RepID=A0A6P7X022_9AMPH|nr:matrix Gla protein [Microcaecilia unicolor]XP_030045844.1 matrix Gla protein [Microcaecilia unicolor]
MRVLFIVALLAILAVVTFCSDSHESYESFERYHPFVNRRKANNFIGLQQKKARTYERIRELNKSPKERQREICEDHDLCELYAMRHGFQKAYKRYFGQKYGRGK